jgi:acetyl esterase/lipase
LREQVGGLLAAHQTDTEGVEKWGEKVPGPVDATVDEPEVPVRVYRSVGLGGATPGVLNIRGGGFMLGNVATDDGTRLHLVRAPGVVIVSVDLRLAPQHPFPAGPEDCYALSPSAPG